MNLLADTHVWIWSQESPEKLGPRSRAAFLDTKNSIFISTASTLEIARLLSMGRLGFTMEIDQWVEKSIQLLAADTIPISHEIAIESYRLPEPFQRDPADRLLVATARIHGFKLMTADELILGYASAQSVDARR